MIPLKGITEQEQEDFQSFLQEFIVLTNTTLGSKRSYEQDLVSRPVKCMTEVAIPQALEDCLSSITDTIQQTTDKDFSRMTFETELFSALIAAGWSYFSLYAIDGLVRKKHPAMEATDKRTCVRELWSRLPESWLKRKQIRDSVKKKHLV